MTGGSEGVPLLVQFRRNTCFPKCFQGRGPVCDLCLFWLLRHFSYMIWVSIVKRASDEKSEIWPVGNPESCVLRAP